MYINPRRYSGYRISLLHEGQQKEAWTKRLEDIQWILPLLQDAMREKYFTDDTNLDIPFPEVVRGAMETGELFGCMAEAEDGTREPVGFVLLRDVRPGRDAWMEGYTVPKYRGKYPCAKQLAQILEYCFTPWNPESTPSQMHTPIGLGLRKIKAQFSSENIPAQRTLWRCGFTVSGQSPLDGLFKGTLTDIITVEKINPLYLPKEYLNAEKSREAARRADVSSPAAIPAGTGISRPLRGEQPTEPSPDAGSSAASPELAASGGKRTGGGRKRGPEQLRERVAEPEGQPELPEEHASRSERVSRIRATRAGAKPVGRSSKRTGRK